MGRFEPTTLQLHSKNPTAILPCPDVNHDSAVMYKTPRKHIAGGYFSQIIKNNVFNIKIELSNRTRLMIFRTYQHRRPFLKALNKWPKGKKKFPTSDPVGSDGPEHRKLVHFSTTSSYSWPWPRCTRRLLPYTIRASPKLASNCY